jgi:TonB family protein
MKALIRYLAQNVKYPEAAIISGAEGRVTCTFIVGANGAISNVGILRGIDPVLDAEAVRVLQAMPHWSPGKQRGIAVDVKYTIPVTFRHPKNIKKKTT